MQTLELDASKREAKGKGGARKLRQAGEVPAIVYGKDGNMAVRLDRHIVSKKLRNLSAGNTVVDLKVDGHGSDVMALIKEVQRDPITDEIMHIDFNHISLDQQVHVQAPVHLVGTSPGVKLGGILEFTIRELDIACEVSKIPSSVDIDISELAMDEYIYVHDLKAKVDYEVLTPSELAIVGVHGKKAEEEVETDEDAIAAPTEEDGESETKES